MKEIILRQAKLGDYYVFENILTTENSSLMYGYPNEYDPSHFRYEGEAQDIIKEYLEAKETQKPIDLYEVYKENVRNIFFVVVDGIFEGLISLKKERKKIRITDFAILNDSIINEDDIQAILNLFIEKTKASELYLWGSSRFLTQLLVRIGFEADGATLTKHCG